MLTLSQPYKGLSPSDFELLGKLGSLPTLEYSQVHISRSKSYKITCWKAFTLKKD